MRHTPPQRGTRSASLKPQGLRTVQTLPLRCRKRQPAASAPPRLLLVQSGHLGGLGEDDRFWRRLLHKAVSETLQHVH